MRVLLLLAACLSLGTTARSQTPEVPRETYQALNALRVDASRTYYVREAVIRRDVVRIFLTEGKLAFFERYRGKIVGAVFTGQGRVIAYPRDQIERRSLARYLGSPVLDLKFTSAYLRFTDDTARELQRSLDEGQSVPVDDPAFSREWESAVATLNPWHSLRTLTDALSSNDLPYFYAGMDTEAHGPLDVIVDQRREEPVGIGQPRWVNGAAYYDLWTAFAGPNAKPLLRPFDPVSYTVETTIRPDLELEGSTTAEMVAVRGGERLLEMELSRQLRVESVTDEQGRPLPWFQNEGMDLDEAARQGNDVLLVVLPEAAPAGGKVRLSFRYRGRVISDAGNGAYYVGARGIWYPNLGGFGRFATFDLSFRWPRTLELVANGKKVSEGVEGEQKTGRWVSDAPVTIAGFNLGNYERRDVSTDRFVIEVYANKHLETAMVDRMRRNAPTFISPPRGLGPRRVIIPVLPDLLPPSPAEHLDQLGKDVLDAIRFNESVSVPFPYGRLAVAQIPGSFGQGWPGLLYLSTLSFLSPGAQSRMGASQRTQEQYLDLVPPHEVAHQWWGNLVGWPTYRDQWIHEALSNYLALMFADSRRPNDKLMGQWLDIYRTRLSQKETGGDALLSEAGPLVLGRRLVSSRSPGGAYGAIIYGKGTWVAHMLRMMLRDEKAAEPDARFFQLLRTLAVEYRHKGLTTEDLQREVEKLMTPEMDLEGGRSLDWFFDQYVQGTEIPHYSVDYKVARVGERFVVTGTLKQKDVNNVFVARVPLYAETARGRMTLLGVVTTSGEETRFRFPAGTAPRKLVVDPHRTLLAFIE